jgi:hypothetical protein
MPDRKEKGIERKGDVHEWERKGGKKRGHSSNGASRRPIFLTQTLVVKGFELILPKTFNDKGLRQKTALQEAAFVSVHNFNELKGKGDIHILTN